MTYSEYVPDYESDDISALAIDGAGTAIFNVKPFIGIAVFLLVAGFVVGKVKGLF
jgi:hypothetical protein